jgi:curved DNA-binding protein CbpA
MGGSSSRPQTYDQYYKSLQDAPTISSNDVNPYEVLGLNKNFDWDELTQAFRRVAKQVHPDKGGPDEVIVRTQMFRIATDCFKQLARDYKMREEGKPHHDLKREAEAYYSENPQRQAPPPSSQSLSQESFIDRFNRTFETNRLEDEENATGYGNAMAASSKVREDIAVPQILTKFTSDAFNKKFDKITLASSKDVIVYREPEALPLAKKMAYTELGGDKPDDFSSTREGTRSKLDYTDYMRAHTQTRLVDPRAVAKRKEYKNVDAFEADRARVIAQPRTQDELEYEQAKERERTQAEEARLMRLKQKDAYAAAHHDRMNRMMLGGAQ